jgi:hypothetical protein
MKKYSLLNTTDATAARKRKPALQPKRCTMELAMSWLKEAPMPAAALLAAKGRTQCRLQGIVKGSEKSAKLTLA